MRRYWSIKKIAIEEGGHYGHTYETSAEVVESLRDGWEPFAVTLEQGGLSSDYPWLWLKKLVNSKDAVSVEDID